jgi:membrane-bound serine protease (ClpP class)
MKKPLQIILIVLVCLLLLSSQSFAETLNDANETQHVTKAAVIPCKDMIDDGLYKSIQRRTKLAIEQGANYLIYEIGTYGGFLDSADNISKYFILRENWPDAGKNAHTVAYITTEAISAGAMISISCQDIIMRENTTIGDCAPVTLGGKLEGVEREKTESFVRGTFERAAEANGYPKPLLKAMVTMQIEVYRVKNLDSGEYEFFETDDLPTDPNKYDLENQERVVKDNELLTLTASQAEKYKIARAVVKDRAGALAFLAERDGVTFVGEPMVLKTSWSEEMIRWLYSPAVMGVLVMIALLGIYIELSTPGIGLPGLVAAICFAIIIGSKYLVGLANWVEVALFVAGLVLLMVEIFLLPGFGVAGTLGIICILAGVFGMFIKNPPDSLPWPQSPLDWQIFLNGLLGLSLGFVGFIVLALLLAKYLPKIQFLSGLILVPTAAKQAGAMRVSMTRPPESTTAVLNIGEQGEVTSTLRPTGKVRFGDAIVDVVATAEFLSKGTKVEITEIHGNRVVVKRINEQSKE